MDTAPNPRSLAGELSPESSTSVPVGELLRRFATARWPIVIDVRKEPAYVASRDRMPGAPDAVDAISPLFAPDTEVVCVCVHGHEVSRGAAETLRKAGLAAQYLEGGFEEWRSSGGPLRRADSRRSVPPLGGSRWVTRARPKIDRIACPWLVRRFVDPRARTDYLPESQVLAHAARTGALAFDLPGGTLTHEGERCSFDAFIDAFGLDDPALRRLAEIVRGADTSRLDLTPESAGLVALSVGLSRLFDDDLQMLEAGLTVYDALYAWCRDADAGMLRGGSTSAAQ
jgi:rhodanese-related sulfurtransferase